MPIEPTPRSVIVELELTPTWWTQLTKRLQQGDAHKPVRELHAQACAVAFKLGGAVQMLKTERSAFVARLSVPTDVSLAVLCERAAAVIEELNALDLSAIVASKAAGY